MRTFADAPVWPRWLSPLGWAALVMLVGSQAYGFLVSAPDRDMGDLQKILYVHVPSAWAGFIAFFLVFVSSILYLWRRHPRYDLFAASAAEVGVVLIALTLALGSAWGRPTWGVWWTWDARLTSTAILFLLYAGYLALRAFTEDPERRARWSAAAGILAFLNVPIVYMSVRWWRTLHQIQSSPETLDPSYTMSLRLNAVAFLLVLVCFVMRRYHVARLEWAAAEELEKGELGRIAIPIQRGVHV